MDVLYGLTKDFVFKEAVAFLKGKRTSADSEDGGVCQSCQKELADEYDFSYCCV